MDFITLLQEKAFKRYFAHIARDNNQEYKIVRYNSGIDNEFFSDLVFDLSLPIEQKKFNFSIAKNDLKGFKNTVLQSVIKQKPTEEQFDHLFFSFFKHIPLSDLLNAVSVKSDCFGKVSCNPVYQRYILYFLHQDFSHQDFYPLDFLQLLQFNFPVNENNYLPLKEGLYAFLDNHAFLVKDKIRNGYNNGTNVDSKIKEFENSLYNCVSSFIKTEDLKSFHVFWPRILIQSNNDNMITTINNTFVFDLSYSYLSDTYSKITNEEIAHNTCHFIKNIINDHLDDYMTASIIQQTSSSSRFVIEFKKSANKQHIPDIFDSIIQIQEKTNQFTHHFLRSEFKPIFDQSMEYLKTNIDYLSLGDKMPEKNTKEKKLKI